MIQKTSTVTHNLLMGMVIIFAALVVSSAKATESSGQFLPLKQKTTLSGNLSSETGRQFIPLRAQNRATTEHKMISLNGGSSGRTYKLANLQDTPRVPKAKDVPDEVKLAMANGYVSPSKNLPDTAAKREMIAAALAPIIEGYEREHVQGEDDIDTDIEDAHAALAASLPDSVHHVVDKALAYVWPVADAHYRISSPYGYRTHPVTKKRAFHAGIDIPAPAGTSVMAAIEGEVAAVGEHPRLGRYVKVSHADGTYSLYGHLQKWMAKAGDHVKAGDIIGKVGSTGRSTGPHLDFSIRRDGKPFNPMNILASVLDEKKLAMNK